MQRYLGPISKLITTKAFKADIKAVRNILIVAIFILAAAIFCEIVFFDDNILQVILKFLITFILSLGISILILIVYSKIATSKDIEDKIDNLKIESIIDYPEGMPSEKIDVCINESTFKMDSRILAYLVNGNYDLENTFYLRSGPLDMPKLSLLNIKNSDKDKMQLDIGFSSFKDIYLTHYFCDNIITDQYSTEEKERSCMTLRRVLNESIKDHYSNQILRYNETKIFELYRYLPNPLGVTGMVEIYEDGQIYVVFKKRKKDQIKDKELFQWTFAGLIDFNEFLYPEMRIISIYDIIKQEYYDEFKCSINQSDKIIDEKVYFIGLILNEKYLFQPEMIVKIKLKVKNDLIRKELIKKGFYCEKKENAIEFANKHNMRLLCKYLTEKYYRNA